MKKTKTAEPYVSSYDDISAVTEIVVKSSRKLTNENFCSAFLTIFGNQPSTFFQCERRKNSNFPFFESQTLFFLIEIRLVFQNYWSGMMIALCLKNFPNRHFLVRSQQ